MMNKNILIKLINSNEINDWINIFNQKIEKEKIKNSEYMKSYNKTFKLSNDKFLFIEELEIINILEKIDKKMAKKEKLKIKIAKKYQKATENEKQEKMQKLEVEMDKVNKKIITLTLIKEENKNKIKDLEKKCQLLRDKDNSVGTLTEEDRTIRDVENKIWKVILDDYFKNKEVKFLKWNDYEKYICEIEMIFQEIKKDQEIKDKNSFFKKSNILLNIVKTLYMDILRDELFLKKENIEIELWENIDLTEKNKQDIKKQSQNGMNDYLEQQSETSELQNQK